MLTENASLNLSVREAILTDIALLNEIMRLSKGYWGYDQAFMDAFMHRFAISATDFSHHSFHILCKKTNPIGFFSFEMNEDHLLELDHFFLHPHYIGQGLGKQLWKECCAAADKLGAQEFIVWSDPHAESFYAKMGCEKIGNRKSPFLPDRYLPIMRYKLPEDLKVGER